MAILTQTVFCQREIPPVAEGDVVSFFRKIMISETFFSEGAHFGDVNQDGAMDIVSGPYWYAGPDWKEKREIYEPKPFEINGYSDNFFCWVRDLDADGYPDVLVAGFPGKEAFWYRNPGGDVAAQGRWPRYLAASSVDNESPEFLDVTGDGKPELLCSFEGRYGWWSPVADPEAPWEFTAVTPKTLAQRFTHGIGAGDVDGDGKTDILEATHWWKNTGGDKWEPHKFDLGGPGGAQMFAVDLDGDGDADVVSSLNAHGYGVAWFENTGRNAEGEIQWKRHLLAGREPQESDYGIVFSQPHAVAVADLNGDGLLDIVTGKRYWAHNGNDPDEEGPRVIYWFQAVKTEKGLDFIPRLADAESGVGTQVVVGDVNGDGMPDIVTANKSGVYVLTQYRSRAISESEARPSKLYGEGLVPQEDYLSATTPEQALRAMKTQAGFAVDLVASEPRIKQPVAMCFDHAGRLWLAEGMTYPRRAAEGEGQDRILVLEDADGDGSFEKTTVFAEGLNLVSGLRPGFGGVFVGAAPYLMFLADADDDLKPDAAPEILLDGWGYQDTHETLNSLTWGPDGWLYGTQGVFTHSKVGKPGAPDAERVPLNCCVWRFHPVSRKFEVFSHGTSNPWGLDFTEEGELVITSCVIPHAFHMVEGGRYVRQAGQHFNTRTWSVIGTIADHAHFAGGVGDHAHWGDRHNQHDVPVPVSTDAAGGGHAHCGLVIYKGGLFPSEWHGRMIFGNLHGHRLVTDVLRSNGSSLTASHSADFLRADDHWFVPVTQITGPDGALYVSDWQDKTTCHHDDPVWWDRTNGRIFRVRSRGWEPGRVNLRKAGDEELVALIPHKNEWFAREARVELQYRASRKGTLPDSVAANEAGKLLFADKNAPLIRLRALWTLHAMGALSAADAERLLTDRQPEIRAWAVRLFGEEMDAAQLVRAADDEAPVVRRNLASLLQKIPESERLDSLKVLASREADAEDPILPHLLWYAAEPLLASEPALAGELIAASKQEAFSNHANRLLAELPGGEETLLRMAVTSGDPAQIESLARALRARGGNLRGVQTTEPLREALLKNHPADTYPAHWEIAALMGDEPALAYFRGLVAGGKNPAEREAALLVLTRAADRAGVPVIHRALADPALRSAAVHALASLADENTPAALLGVFGQLEPARQIDAVAILASTSRGSLELVRSVKSGKIPRSMLHEGLARQMAGHGNEEVNRELAALSAMAADERAALNRRRESILAAVEGKAGPGNAVEGRKIFAGLCGACHRLYGQGALVGPDLTGSNRRDLNYLLDNILDPGALVTPEYQLTMVSLKDGRIQAGIVRSRDERGMKLALAGGAEISVSADEIAKVEALPVSLMPAGLTDALDDSGKRDLFAYLRSENEPPAEVVPGLIEAEGLGVKASAGQARAQNMTAFPNGRWSGESQLWWTGGQPGDKLEISFPVEKAGSYRIFAKFTRAVDYAAAEVFVNDGKTPALAMDFFDPEVTATPEIDLGEHELRQGENKLILTITGKAERAVPGFMLGIDFIRLSASE